MELIKVCLSSPSNVLTTDLNSLFGAKGLGPCHWPAHRHSQLGRPEHVPLPQLFHRVAPSICIPVLVPFQASRQKFGRRRTMYCTCSTKTQVTAPEAQIGQKRDQRSGSWIEAPIQNGHRCHMDNEVALYRGGVLYQIMSLRCILYPDSRHDKQQRGWTEMHVQKCVPAPLKRTSPMLSTALHLELQRSPRHGHDEGRR